MTLVKCENLWGEAHLMYGEPPLRQVDGAAFLPYRPEGPWGVFDASRKIIIDAVDLRGASRTPHQTDLLWPEDLIVEQEAPDELYIYCGWLNPHFGHFLINSLPKFWPFLRGPVEAKILCASPASGMPAFIQTVLERMDIAATDIVSFDRPTAIRTLLVPTPSILEQYWAYGIYRDLCQRIGAGLWQPDEVSVIDRPVYLSKSKLSVGVGRFDDESVIEATVKAAGIEVVHPELLSFPEQVRLLATRKLIIGPSGSAFHASIFAPKGRQIVCFCPTREINSNFVLIDMLCENNAEYYYQEGMTYGTSSDFMTVVRAADVHQLGKDLVRLAQERVSWD